MHLFLVKLNHNVCAIECKSSYRSSFTRVDGSGRTVNSIHHSSIAYCFAESYYTMYHWYGYVDIQSVNLSHNKASEQSAVDCGPDKPNKDNIGTSISYSSFADNNATSQYCIYLTRAATSTPVDQYKIINSNIIRNIGDRTICTFVNTNMNDCCIMNNIEDNIFYTSPPSGGFTLTNCSVDNINSYNTKPNIDNIGRKIFINNLTFIQTGSCVNIFDTVDIRVISKHMYTIYQYTRFIILSLFIYLFSY